MIKLYKWKTDGMERKGGGVKRGEVCVIIKGQYEYHFTLGLFSILTVVVYTESTHGKII